MIFNKIGDFFGTHTTNTYLKELAISQGLIDAETGALTRNTAAKQANANATTTIASGEVLLTTEKIAQITAIKGVTSSELEQLKTQLALNTAEGQGVVTTKALTSSDIQQAVASLKVSDASKKQMLSIMGVDKAQEEAATSAGLLGKALNLIKAHPVIAAIAGIAVVGATVFSVVHKSVKELEEEMENSLSNYENAKSEVKNITTELKNQEQELDILLAKENLTYVEKGQLEELQEITKELRIQQDLAEKEESRTKKQLALDASDLFNKQFGDYEISEQAISDNMEFDAFKLVTDKNDISAMIAGYKQYNELLDEAYGTRSQVEIDHYKSVTDDLKDSIFATAQELKTQQDNISAYYESIKDTPYEDLTSEQQEIVDSYNSIANTIALIYQQLDPNTWNSMQIDNVLATENIEKTKSELVEMAKSGTLTPEVISGYTNLNNALEKAGISASILYDEIQAIANPNAYNYDELKHQLQETFGFGSGIHTLWAVDMDKQLTELGLYKEDALEVFATIKAKYVNGETESWTPEDWIANIQEGLNIVEPSTEVSYSFSYDKLEDIPQKLSDVESAYQTAQDALDSYNEHGYYSMSVIDSILALEDEYINILVDENGQLQINSDSMNQLAAIKIEAAKASIYQETCEELVRIKTLDTALAAQELALINGTLTESAYETARALYTEVQAMGGANELLANEVWNSASKKIKLLDNQLNSLNNGSYSVDVSVAKDSAKDVEQTAKEYIESYMEFQKLSLEKGLIDYNTYCNNVSALLSQMFNDGKISAEEYHNYTKEMLESQKDIYDKALSAIQRRYDKEIEKIQDSIENIEKQNEALEKQKELMDNAASVVVDYYDSLIEAENKSIESLNESNEGIQSQIDKYDSLVNVADKLYENEQKALEEQKESIQEKIDLLQEENEEKDLQYRKEQALYELERSKNQRTKKLLTENGFVYKTDDKAISEAKKNVEDIKTEELISSLEKEQEVLQDSIDSLQEYRDMLSEIANAYDEILDIRKAIELVGDDYVNVILGTNINDWTALKDKYISANDEMADNDKLIKSHEDKIEIWEEEKKQWEELSSVIDDETKNQAAIQEFGADWQKQINEGRLDNFEEFKNKYLTIQNQINDNTVMIDSYNEKIQYYEDLKSQWSDIADVYEQSVEDQYAAMLLGANWEKDILDNRLDKFNSFKNEYLNIQKAITDAAWNTANEQNKANASVVNQKTQTSNSGNTNKTQTEEPEKKVKWYVCDSSRGVKVSDGYDTMDAAMKKLKTIDPKKYPVFDLVVRAFEEYHTGLDKGYVGSINSDNNRLKLLQKAGNGELLPNEELTILQKGELVLTKAQQMNIAETLIKRSMLPNISMQNYPMLNNVAMRNMQPVQTISIGDIHLHGVQNVSDFGKALETYLPNISVQFR